MTQPRPSLPPAAEPPIDEAALADLSLPDSSALVRHADGYYWVAPDGRQEFGPFETAQEALDDMNAAGEDDIEPGSTLQEVEQELGLSEWVDSDTGELAEQTWTRLEDH